MISRVYRGAGTYGLVKYLFGMGRRNEHADPRLVASWDGDPTGVTPTYDRGTGTFAVGPLAGLLDQPLAACSRHDPRHVYHLVLRIDAADRVLTDAEWAEVAGEAMAATGWRRMAISAAVGGWRCGTPTITSMSWPRWRGRMAAGRGITTTFSRCGRCVPSSKSGGGCG